MALKRMVIIDLIEWIDDHIDDIESIEQVYLHAGYSRSHTSRLFKEIVGMTISQHIRQRKIKASIAHLENDDLRIIDIALECNYSSSQGFIRAFKRLHKCTPTNYRKRIKAAEVIIK